MRSFSQNIESFDSRTFIVPHNLIIPDITTISAAARAQETKLSLNDPFDDFVIGKFNLRAAKSSYTPGLQNWTKTSSLTD